MKEIKDPKSVGVSSSLTRDNTKFMFSQQQQKKRISKVEYLAQVSLFVMLVSIMF